jgi:SAM-dependent methyltransferase
MTETTLDALRRLGPWHFDIRLPDGTRTSDVPVDPKAKLPGVLDPHELEPLLKSLYPEGLRGRSFIDVACNGGGYSILAKELGADYAFGFDSRQHWIDQANFLVKQFGLSGIKFQTAALHEVDFDRDFDICLFKGIMYHLPDPIHSLQTLCARTSDVIIVDTETDGERGELCLRLNIEHNMANLMTGMHGFAWWPSGPDLVTAVLARLGFPASRELRWSKRKKSSRRTQGGRCRIVAARDPARLARIEDKLAELA